MEKLTQQEEEAMLLIWEKGGGFIKDFLEQMPAPRPPYTTLASVIKKLETKGYLSSQKIGNSYCYSPLIKAEEYKKRFMSGFVSDYFRNSYKELVAFFAKDEKISADELEEIIEMIKNRKTD